MATCDRPGALCSTLGAPAFTLVELLIVVVLISIAATMAMPLMAGTDATRLQAAARLLAADLGFAQVESITHAADPCVVVFDQANDSYAVARSSAPSTAITDPSTNQPYVTQFGSGRAAELSGVSIQGYSLGGDNQLEFGAYGQTDQTTPATITFEAAGLTVTVEVDPTSGEVSLLSGGM